MKAVLACGWLALALACSIDHASDEIACTTQADCDGSRSCVDGYCVVASTSCPGGCASCDTAAKTCAIDSNGNGKVTCPDGWSCTITCSNNACRDVDCEGAASCTVQCLGAGSCDAVKCGAGRCQIACTGASSCGDVDCRDACACEVTCTGSSSCDTAHCPASCAAGAGCASQPATCDRC